jgi:rare lipoprotein A
VTAAAVPAPMPEPGAKSAGAPARPAMEAAIPGTGAGPVVAVVPASKADPAAARPAPGAAAEPPAARATAPEELPRERAGTRAARGWWLQLGAYRSAEGAAQHQRQISGAVGWLAPLLTLFREDTLNKVQAGPFPSRAEAQAASQRLRSQLPLVPMLVERR